MLSASVIPAAADTVLRPDNAMAAADQLVLPASNMVAFGLPLLVAGIQHDRTGSYLGRFLCHVSSVDYVVHR
jgi:hypothetical protein